MSPDHRHARLDGALILSALMLLAWAPNARALRVVDYNVLNYPGNSGPARDPLYRTILSPLSPDILVTEEQTSAAGVGEFLTQVLNTMEPAQWDSAQFVDGNDTDCGFFYKPSKVQFLGQWYFYPNPLTNLRYVHVYRVRPVGYTSGAAEIRFYAFHLKASTGSSNVSARLAEATGIRDSMNAMPPGTHAFALGDFNFYTGTEPGLAKFLETQTVNIGQLYDPLGLQDIQWQDNTSIMYAWTQSPCGTGDTGCASGAATGGMDDRFDLILPTLNWNDGQGYELIPNSYVPVGNDGLHHNVGITAPPTIPEGAAYATALHGASDHLPVRVDLQLPAQSTAPTMLAIGTVIVGGGASLSIGNPATPPADALTYSFAAPAGFAAPSGTFDLAAGGPDASHSITTTAGAPGSRSGDLVITTDDPDHPTRTVTLTANVLDHAVAALDSLTPTIVSTVDFGTHGPGQFSPQSMAVYNYAYSSLQARLALNGASITGGAGRFSIAGGFSPALIADAGQRYDVVFDDAGATPDSTYDATLTFTSDDEALPGAEPQPDLVVTLSARATGSSTGIGGPSAPTATVLYAPFPNPQLGSSTVRFDLAKATDARLEVFDLGGRHIATLANRAFEPGRYSLSWDGRSDAGAGTGPGVYFVRLSGRGIKPQTARIAVVK